MASVNLTANILQFLKGKSLESISDWDQKRLAWETVEAAKANDGIIDSLEAGTMETWAPYFRENHAAFLRSAAATTPAGALRPWQIVGGTTERPFSIDPVEKRRAHELLAGAEGSKYLADASLPLVASVAESTKTNILDVAKLYIEIFRAGGASFLTGSGNARVGLKAVGDAVPKLSWDLARAADAYVAILSADDAHSAADAKAVFERIVELAKEHGMDPAALTQSYASLRRDAGMFGGNIARENFELVVQGAVKKMTSLETATSEFLRALNDAGWLGSTRAREVFRRDWID